MRQLSTRHPKPIPRSRPATIQAIGAEGWAVAERMVDARSPLVVEEAADELRAAVRSDRGWIPRLVVFDDQGLDVTANFDVN